MPKPESQSKSPLIGWTPELESLRALSVRQPYAWLIVNGFKDIENRSWRTNHRGPLLIHASQNDEYFNDDNCDQIESETGIVIPQKLDMGGIVGVVDIADCVQKHNSLWFGGPWGWVLANARQLPFRECKGAVSLFKPLAKR